MTSSITTLTLTLGLLFGGNAYAVPPTDPAKMPIDSIKQWHIHALASRTVHLKAPVPGAAADADAQDSGSYPPFSAAEKAKFAGIIEAYLGHVATTYPHLQRTIELRQSLGELQLVAIPEGWRGSPLLNQMMQDLKAMCEAHLAPQPHQPPNPFSLSQVTWGYPGEGFCRLMHALSDHQIAAPKGRKLNIVSLGCGTGYFELLLAYVAFVRATDVGDPKSEPKYNLKNNVLKPTLLKGSNIDNARELFADSKKIRNTIAFASYPRKDITTYIEHFIEVGGKYVLFITNAPVFSDAFLDKGSSKTPAEQEVKIFKDWTRVGWTTYKQPVGPLCHSFNRNQEASFYIKDPKAPLLAALKNHLEEAEFTIINTIADCEYKGGIKPEDCARYCALGALLSMEKGVKEDWSNPFLSFAQKFKNPKEDSLTQAILEYETCRVQRKPHTTPEAIAFAQEEKTRSEGEVKQAAEAEDAAAIAALKKMCAAAGVLYEEGFDSD